MWNSLRRNAALAASILGLVLFALSCGGSNSDGMSGSGGPVQIQITASGADAALSAIPADALKGRSTGGAVRAMNGGSGGTQRPPLQSFEITFEEVAARDLDGNLVPVTIALPATIDVLGLRTGRTVELPVGFLPPGDYRGFEVTLSSAVLLLDDGTRITIEPPSGGFTTQIATRPFTVVDGQPTTVKLNFRFDRALRWIGNHFQFFPDFDCEVGGGRGDHGSGDDGSGGDDDSGSGDDGN